MTEHGWLHRLAFCDCNGGGKTPKLSDNELWRRMWAKVQLRLKAHGFDPGRADGIRGPKTDAALVSFKQSRGLRARSYIGEKTWEALLSEPDKEPAKGTAAPHIDPPWLTVARKYLGLKEIPGPRHHPQILSWWRDLGANWFDDDETPWCGAFVGGALIEAKLPIISASKAPRARAWLEWGVPLDGPAVGAVVVFWRGSRNGASGHVGFVVGKDERGNLMVLGGNQSNAVTIAPFDTGRVLGYRWPADTPLPDTGSLPVVNSRGAALSTNEA